MIYRVVGFFFVNIQEMVTVIQSYLEMFEFIIKLRVLFQSPHNNSSTFINSPNVSFVQLLFNGFWNRWYIIIIIIKQKDKVITTSFFHKIYNQDAVHRIFHKKTNIQIIAFELKSDRIEGRYFYTILYIKYLSQTTQWNKIDISAFYLPLNIRE